MKCPFCKSEIKDNALKCRYCKEDLNVSQKKEEKMPINHKHNLLNKPEEKKVKAKWSNKKIGVLFLTVPVALIVIILFSYTIVTFVTSAIDLPSAPGSEDTLGQNITNLINYFLGLLGLLATLGMIIGIPVGIIYLNKKDNEEFQNFDERSGEGDASVVPDEIKHWNWGAAGLNWIWGIYHRVWLSLLIFIPFVNYIWWIILGIKGSEWAWRKGKWQNVEEFEKSQAKWKPWGMGCLLLPIIIVVIGIILGTVLPRIVDRNRSDNTTSTVSPVREKEEETVMGKEVTYAITFDKNKWHLNEDPASLNVSSEYSFTSSEGDEAWAILIAERIEVTTDALKKIALENIKKSDPNATLISEEKKVINGGNILALKIAATINGVPVIFYNYYYTGSTGTIQFNTYTTSNLFSIYEGDMKELLDGLTVYGTEISTPIQE